MVAYRLGHFVERIRSGTDLISLTLLLLLLLLHHHLLVLVGAINLFTEIRIDWRSRIFDLTSQFQNGGHGVISGRKMLPPDE